MGMATIESEDLFLEKYSTLLVTAWRDENTMSTILADPKKAAIDVGLPVSAGATVLVDRTQPESPYTKTETIRDWTATPGQHILHLPEQPMIDEAELSEAELDAVSGACTVVVIVVL
jgi:hypothetical protein